MTASIQRTTLLMVGAGPTSLSTAMSLVKNGFRDFIVEGVASRGKASRAMTIHATTLGALDTIGCAEPLIKLGIKRQGLQVSNRTSSIFKTDSSPLPSYSQSTPTFRHLSTLPWSTNSQNQIFYHPKLQRSSRWRNAPTHTKVSTWSSKHPKHGMHSSAVSRHGHVVRPEPGSGIQIHFKDSKGNLIRTIEGNEGDDLLSIAHEYDIDLEGACEGSVACSTCHVILTPEYYDRLPEPSDEENDMLDLAFGLTDTSRLGCQVVLTRDLHGMTATLPSATRNMFVDGKKSTHH